ncbi:MAG: pilus assembly protein TadG-related protein [Protaetiibacter sp.]
MRAAVRRWLVRRRAAFASDDGSTLPLVVFYGVLGLAVVLLVTAATSLYLEKKRLFTVADGAALVGAEAFELDEVRLTPDGPRPLLDDAAVASAVADYLAGNPVPELENLTVVRAGTADGLSATVTVSSTWHPPVVTVFVPDGLRLEATATARSVFG